MSTNVAGVVKNGVVVPDAPLPEGAHVQIHLHDPAPEVTPELQEELTAWQRASANALALVEGMAQESNANDKR